MLDGVSRLTFTFDLEDHRPDAGLPMRYPDITRRVFESAARLGVTGTVFVVGEVAEKSPDLVRDIASLGHEIAFHSFAHVPLEKQTCGQFHKETETGKRLLEDLTGKAVIGFRAPVFSLTPGSLWALDSLRELGFDYSSSVLPAKSPLFGFPAAPKEAFRWPNGLLELPAPVARFGPLVLPYLGGVYLRYLPFGLVKRAVARASSRTPLWTYFHPYDFDVGEPFCRIKGAGFLASAILWCNRARTWKKLEALFGPARQWEIAPPFAEQIRQGVFADAPFFRPS